MKTLADFRKKYVYPLWLWFLIGLFFLIATNLIHMEIPRITGRIINDHKKIEQNNSNKPGLAPTIALPPAIKTLQPETKKTDVVQLSIMLILFGFLLMLFRILSRIMFYWPGRKFEAKSRGDIFAKLIRLPQKFFENHKIGDLISRISHDTGYLRVLYAFGSLALINMLLSLGLTISRMADINPTLTLLSLLPFLFMLVYTRFAMPRMHNYSLRNQEAIGNLTARVSEAFANVHVIQANVAQKAFVHKIEQNNHEVYRSNIRLMIMEMVVFPMIAFLANVGQFAVLLYGGKLAANGQLTIGDMIAFNLYIINLAFPLSIMGAILAIYQRSKSAIQRISAIEDHEPEKAQTENSHNFNNYALLEIQKLNFSFSQEQTTPILQDINVSLEKGKKIGIFGPIGCGKTTLFNLITRIHDPSPGKIFLNGVDILSLEPQQLRETIAYAQQTVFLFSDTIRNNISFGLQNISQEEIETAASKAQIKNEILGFDKQWDTQIGEKGIRLSGGQQQRLSLARIFLRKPQIILLDDVLSAVDHTTERKLIKSIDEIQSAVLINSHSSSVLKQCDEILIMVDGQIIDRGDFSALTQRHKHLYEEFNLSDE